MHPEGNVHRKIALLIVAIAVLALVACANTAEDELLPSISASNSPAAATADRPPPQVGGFVGNSIPEFDMTMLDGSTVSSESLATAARPTYLFFFATW
jgi:hypothetical protein|tara:strand:+ start:996 stop:1289 length:294 start_codon:yes stop_codon:yes gene_type:complete